MPTTKKAAAGAHLDSARISTGPFEGVDVAAQPDGATHASASGAQPDDPLAMYSRPADDFRGEHGRPTGDQLPCGFDPPGLPIGLQ